MPQNVDIAKIPSYKQGYLEAGIEIAERMLLEDMPIAQIQRYTRLSARQINEIKVKMKK